MDVAHAEVAHLSFRGSRVPGVDAYGLTTGGDLVLSHVTAGRLDLFGARVEGRLWLVGARLTCADGYALDAPDMAVSGGLYCGGGFTAHGGVNLYGATIGAGVELMGGRLVNRRGAALRAPPLRVAGDVTCGDGFSAVGGVELSGCRVEGRLSFRGADLGGAEPVALRCANADVRESFLDRLRSAPEAVSLSGATVEVIHDDAGFRPEQLDLDRARYVALTPYRPARERIAWIRHGRTGYQPWCYEQLAAYYRRIGHDEDARTVLLAKQRHRRDTLRLPAKLWGRLQDATVGYGYRPLRALGWLGSGIAATAVFFTLNPPKRTTQEGAPHFSAPAYAADVFLPVLDLGQQRAFTPQGAGQWVAWAAVLAGWILATTVIAGITRNVARA
ncbi:hypothetical protein [Streptomyces sp. Ac-502]|uniref:hypothetical protein n=1 Tax=Streptomyces sp. Ac-502 TaxID=3342801 RepID=UPI003862AFF4